MIQTAPLSDNEVVIDLSRTKDLLRECIELVNELHGQSLDDRDAVTGSAASGTKKAELRHKRAQMSQDLQLLATRLELAAGLARVEYWYARGERDPLDPTRDN